MRVRTFISILLALAVVVAVAYLTQQNIELVNLSFRVTAERAVPVYVVLLAVFLLGFLPVVSILLVHSLKQDLARRRQRRFDREARSVRGSFRRAVDLQEDGQLARAAAELEAVLADQPEEFSSLLRYGEVLRSQGRAEEAVEVHRRAAVLYPQSVAVLYQLAEDYEAQGASEVAHQIRDRIVRDFPGMGLRVLRRRRGAALTREEWETGSKLQERIDLLLAEGGDSSGGEAESAARRGLSYERGVTLLDDERFEEAREEFGQILAQDPDFIPCHIMLGEAWLMAGEPDRAVEQWRAGYESTGSATLLQRIEDHFIEGEDPLAAIETLRQIIATAENDLVPRYFLGQLYFRLEMHSEALKVLQGISEHLQQSPSYQSLVGRLHLRRRELPEALGAFTTSLELLGAEARRYVCRICRSSKTSWAARCSDCGSWNALELELGDDSRTARERSRPERPTWPVHERE